MTEKTDEANLAEQFAAFAKQISELQAEATKSYSETIQPVIAQVTEIVAALHVAFKSSPLYLEIQAFADFKAFEEWQRLSSVALEAIKHTKDALDRVELVAKLGWTVPMTMSLPDLVRILSQNDLTIERLDQSFIEYYQRHDAYELTRLKNQLLASDQLKRWHSLIQQCMQAFERGEFAICVPSLLLVFEDSIARPWGVRFQNEKDRRRFFERKISAAAPRSLRGQQWKSLAVFVENIFESGVSETQEHPIPKRNLVLHGKSDPATWEQADCLRLFQAISSVLSLRELVRKYKQKPA